MRLSARMTGLDALSLKVKYLKEAAQRGLKFGVQEAGQILEVEAKVNVPVLTGNLRDHIHTEVKVDEPERQVMVVTPVTEASNPWGIDPAYARRIELGFVGEDSLGRMYHQPAQPYMRPARDTKGAEAVQAIKDSVKSELLDANARTANR